MKRGQDSRELHLRICIVSRSQLIIFFFFPLCSTYHVEQEQTMAVPLCLILYNLEFSFGLIFACGISLTRFLFCEQIIRMLIFIKKQEDDSNVFTEYWAEHYVKTILTL